MITQSVQNRHTAQNGSILITVLVVLFVLSSVLGGVLTLSMQYYSLAEARIDREQAIYLAEAGIEAACQYVSEQGTMMPDEHSASGSIGAGSFSYTIEEKDNSFYEYDITAQGEVSDSARAIEVSGVRAATYAEFAFWVLDNGSIYFKSDEYFYGKIHTGSMPWFSGDPYFQDPFTTEASSYGGSIQNVTFDSGFYTETSNGDMADVDFDDMKTFAQTYPDTALLLSGATELTFDGTQVLITNEANGWDDEPYTLADEQLIYIASGYYTETSYVTNETTTYTTNSSYTSYETNSVLTYTTNYVTSYATNVVYEGQETTWVTITDKNGKTKTKKEKVDVYSTNIVEVVTAEIESGYTTQITESVAYDIESSTETVVTTVTGATEYLDGTLELNGGSLDGRLTIVTDDDIYINNHVEYAVDPLDDEANDADKDDALGLISGDDVIITGAAPDDINIHASIMATGTQSSDDGSFYVDNYSSYSPRGYINLLGGIVQEDRGAVGAFSTYTGQTTRSYAKNYIFDERFEGDPPPYFPPLQSKMTFESWKEVTPES